MRAVPLFLLLFTISLSIAQAPESHRPRKPFLISVDQPVTVQGSFGRGELHGKVRGGGVPVQVQTGSGNIDIR